MGCSQSVLDESQAGLDYRSVKALRRRSSGSKCLSRLSENFVVDKQKNFQDDYMLLKKVGEGAISNIFLVMKKTRSAQVHSVGSEDDELTLDSRIRLTDERSDEVDLRACPYALKEIDGAIAEADSLKEMTNEIRLLRLVDHPNIIRSYEVYDEMEENNIGIVVEYLNGGDLNERAPYTEEQVRRIVAKLVETMHYLHKRGIMHRDVTLENIMFENENEDAQIKLIDFGLAKRFRKGQRFKDMVGTVYTMSPEVIRGTYNHQADMWSVGVIAYQLMAGVPPFWGDDMDATTYKVLRGLYNFNGEAWKGISDGAKDFVRRLLQVDPKTRYTAEQALKDPWIAPYTQRSSRDLSSDVLFNLEKTFVRLPPVGEFRKIAFNTIARMMVADEVNQLREVFHIIDWDHDGCITVDDLKKGLGAHFSDEELLSWFQYADIQHFGFITYTEFLAALLDSQGEIRIERIEEAFGIFDREGKGYISVKNLCDVLNLSEESDYIRQLFREADVDRDGTISFDDFLAVVNGESLKSN